MTVLLETYKKYILFNMVKNHDNELSRNKFEKSFYIIEKRTLLIYANVIIPLTFFAIFNKPCCSFFVKNDYANSFFMLLVYVTHTQPPFH